MTQSASYLDDAVVAVAAVHSAGAQLWLGLWLTSRRRLRREPKDIRPRSSHRHLGRHGRGLDAARPVEVLEDVAVVPAKKRPDPPSNRGRRPVPLGQRPQHVLGVGAVGSAQAVDRNGGRRVALWDDGSVDLGGADVDSVRVVVVVAGTQG